ncbi:hypothetical protein D8674_041446 [Pyrus ussuriensis x Pyrus communis]|uniref:PHD-type domain-containing protein n=1 Tax=Pyrus ussuriensis x Pyrus communis TaxID=2448454 RepID=A0A5N5FLB2_9ROSA|nr:hypothetical protein D8674_041446 [Pyrus ussuriensis x Pyrus communis]
MEVDLVTSPMQEEDAFGVDENYQNTFVASVDCDLLIRVFKYAIIDRGILDCCQHWFCFTCIDNWATITNLCPLCQNEFQMITCVPFQQRLIFPYSSAVACLDGDGCKIRSGSVAIEGDSNLDTSIACDSCELWYHAFCVGFDPEGTSESTWLCPRCVVDEMTKKSDAGSVLRSNKQYGPENPNGEPEAEDNLSRKVSVCVADSGETAVVVSMAGENHGYGKPSESILPTGEVGKDLKSKELVLSTDDSHKLEKPSWERNINQPVLEAQQLKLSLSSDTSSLPSNSLAPKQLRMSTDGSTNEPSSFDGITNASGNTFDESQISNKQSDNDSNAGLHLGLSVGSFLSVFICLPCSTYLFVFYVPLAADMNNNDTEDVKQHNPSEEYFSKAETLIPKEVTDDVKQHDPWEGYSPIADEIVPDANLDAPGSTAGGKRKRIDCSDDIRIIDDDGDTDPKIETKVSAKKIREDVKTQRMASNDQAKESVPDDSENCSILTVAHKDSTLSSHPVEGNTTSDIMSIVRTTKRKSSKGIARSNPADKSSQEQETVPGLRVKKIMRRAAEDKDSSVTVQTLRKEIREALLHAFRTAAAGGPQTEPVKKVPHLALNAKKAILQKGKVRENLTKKIYGTSNGRRTHAWDRDWQIEFWKHRSLGTTEPEKIETLKSVLNLLKERSERVDTEQESDKQSTNPILSRLYLADVSVLPRKYDIKPLLALKTGGNSEQNSKQLTLKENSSKSSLNVSTSNSTETNKVSSKGRAPSLEKYGNKNNVPSSENGAAPNKVHQDKRLEGSLVSSSGASKSKTTSEVVDKTDKRKWALEILARKSGAGTNTTNEKQEDNTLKANYPLLAQLPIDMRPVLASSRHNKIPLSVRQTQLYRLTEHFLKKANLPVIRRTADTELAVVDAINIEKGVADRSSSKLVYMNLCSQEILRRSENRKSSAGAAPVHGSSPSSVPTDRAEQAANELSTDRVIEAALRNAGLLSDSPPNSPHPDLEVPAEEDGPAADIREEGPHNVFEMDFQPDLDIYGDFEYNLEDEDYIGAAAAKVTNPQPDEGAPKLKLVFSTLQPERSNHNLDLEKPETMVEVRKDSSSMLENHTCSGLKNSITEGANDETSVPLESLFGKEGEELTVAECEELYGPDKEPLIKSFPEASEKLSGLIDEALVKDKDSKENENYAPKSNQAVKTNGLGKENNLKNMLVASGGCNSSGREDSANHIQPGETVDTKEKKSTTGSNNQSNSVGSVSKKVEAYIKEHIRPLCKSGVITAEQYKWAVAKTTGKVTKYHSKSKNANFLIKEGEKVKKLADNHHNTTHHDRHLNRHHHHHRVTMPTYSSTTSTPPPP